MVHFKGEVGPGQTGPTICRIGITCILGMPHGGKVKPGREGQTGPGKMQNDEESVHCVCYAHYTITPFVLLIL